MAQPTSHSRQVPSFARLIEVTARPVGDGTVLSSSEDLSGLSVITPDEAGARVSVPSMIFDLLSGSGERSIVLPVDGGRTDILGTWVAIPVAMVESALEDRARG